MEPRARAAKNVGRTNFPANELAMLLTAHGDVPNPLPETIKVLDEIATEFIQGLSFEATRVAHHANRQKVKFEDFQFAMRRDPALLGKVQEMLDKKVELTEARKAFDTTDNPGALTEGLAADVPTVAMSKKKMSLKTGSVTGASTATGSGKRKMQREDSVAPEPNSRERDIFDDDDLGDIEDEDFASAVTAGSKKRKI